MRRGPSFAPHGITDLMGCAEKVASAGAGALGVGALAIDAGAASKVTAARSTAGQAAPPL